MGKFYGKGGTQQDERVRFQQATGGKKAMLALLGRDASGNENTFGKIMSASPLSSASLRGGANLVTSKNSDVGRQVRSTNKEGIAQNVAVLDFAGEAAKTALTFGAGGGGGGVPGVPTGATPPISASTATGAAPSMSTPAVSGGVDATSAISGGAGSGGPSIGAMSPGAPTSPMDFSSGDVGSIEGSTPTNFQGSEASGGDPYADALNSDSGKKLTEMKEESDIENTKDELEKDKKKTDSDKKKNENLNKALESAPPLISKGAKVFTTTKSLRNAEKENLETALSRTKKAEYGNYL